MERAHAKKSASDSRSSGPAREDITRAPDLRSGNGVERLVAELVERGFIKPEIFDLVAPRRTLERRAQTGQPLSSIETDRALRLKRVHDHALRVFGNREKAHRWLRKPCRALDGTVPIQLLATETGAHIVESELHAIDHGMYV